MFSAQNQWKVAQKIDETKVEELVQATQAPKLVVEILIRRGYETAEKITQFLKPNLSQLNDPFLLHDMQKACERIKKAITSEEKIVVYGDYDADGLTSTSIMYEALLQLGADVRYYIPDRFTDGYGPNLKVYQRLISEGTGLIVTVDNGVSGNEAVNYAQQHGVDVVITDHHEMPAELPHAYAIVHPRHPEGQYPFAELSGAGVAFKTASALLEEVPQEMLDLAAIGTVADIVSLTGENRVLVSFGLKVLQNTERVGLLALYQQAHVDQQKISAETIGFALAPRLNALGRMENGAPGVELLTTFDDQRAAEIAVHVQELNSKRQELVNQITTEALAQVQEQANQHPVNLLVGQGWHEGVLGIVASRVVEATGKPTLVLNADSETGQAKGSGRSVAAFDLFAALDGHRDQLVAFGGHQMACGLTIMIAKQEAVQQVLDQAAQQQHLADAKQPELQLAGTVDLATFALADLEQIEVLAPFGQDNSQPLFNFTGYQIQDAKPMGKENNHLRLTLKTTTNQQLSAVYFGIDADKLGQIMQAPTKVEFVGYVDKNEWQNQVSLQIKISDLKLEAPVTAAASQEPLGESQIKEPPVTTSVPVTVEIFDQRSKKLTVKMLQQKGTYAFFSEKIKQQVQRYLPANTPVVLLPQQAGQFQAADLYVVDCPADLRDLQKVLQNLTVQRLHLLLYQKNDLFEIGLPSRQQFGNLYRFVLAHPKLNLRQVGTQMATRLKLPKELMIFMLQVFFEVGFVKIENGLVTGVPGTKQVNLKETSSYHSRRLQIRTQEILLHSKSTDLIKWVNEQIKPV
ncbi:single-stranded-DNA-specific exonuclease [Ligilactobacillus pabuli]|uniref:Single-stranded-DNA-specific exonuclease RecJ n=1 Tax=Ligilactobacillus pabuli TaxID=2886039 RepID=A0ABQ5JGF6_9LACO|nr:single-stranded-DNA-specific exonuclease RecJ [Ligilactobacillus pabuli]GKS80926.1 single-stranded-DNA-specific exonuclease [Ligilactobacillus pabuli]